MGTIKINGEELDEALASELISKGKDYTKKTMELSEMRRQLEAASSEVAQLKILKDYADANPEFNKKMFMLLEKQKKLDAARAAGISLDDEEEDEDIDDSDEDAIVYSPNQKKSKKEKVVTVKQMQSIIANLTSQLENKHNLEKQNEYINSRIEKDFDTLKSLNYSKEELVKIGEMSKKENKFPLEMAEIMAFRRDIPDRFHQENKQEKAVTIMKPESSAVLGFDNIEEELSKHRGDPRSLLEANRDKLFK